MLTFEHPVRLVRELKGAPLSVLFALATKRQGVSQTWLESVTGYTDKPVQKALAYLQEAGLITHSCNGWRLSDGGKLFPLPLAELEPGSSENPPGQDPQVEDDDPPVDESRNNSEVEESLESLVNLKDDILEIKSLTDSESGNFPSSDVILTAAGSLFGHRILGKPGEYGNPRLLLAWIAQAWHNRQTAGGKTRSPAGLVHWAFHKGRGKSAPEPQYLERPEAFLPDTFLDAVFGVEDDDSSPADLGVESSQAQDQAADPDQALMPVITPIRDGLTAQMAWDKAVEMQDKAASPHLRNAHLVSYQDGLFTVGVVDAYALSWLASRLQSALKNLLVGLCNRQVTLEFILLDTEVST